MDSVPSVRRGPNDSGAFRYGMLALVVALWCFACWTWFSRAPDNRSSATMNLVVASMLLVNHVIGSFLSVERRRRVLPFQAVFLAGCLLYVFRGAFHL